LLPLDDDPTLIQPSLDDFDDIDPGETVRGWIVFGLPPAAVPVAFTYQVLVGDRGVWSLTPSLAASPTQQ
jgi:hypothetical protein